MTAPLIGLVGRARSGKDTLADLLVEQHGYTKLAMADRLREMATDIDPVVGAETASPYTSARLIRYSDAVGTLGYERAKDVYPELRRFLQRLGTEGVRKHLGADVWVRMAERRMGSTDGPLVFTDIRFPNEADMIRRNGGVIIAVDRGGRGDGHVSEDLDQLVAEADRVIANHGTLAEYLAEVERTIADILNGD